MSSRLNALTSLRFFAALAILVHHSQNQFLPQLPQLYLDQGVSFFFVLSGFILTIAYPALLTPIDVKRFFVARIARIWPAHVVGLCLYLGILGASNVLAPPLSLFTNLSMTHAWVPLIAQNGSYNPVSWTISTEFGFYIIFPFLIYNFASTWWWKLAIALGLLFSVVAVCQYFEIRSFDPAYAGVTDWSLLYINPVSRLFEFVLGMTTALAWTSMRPRLSNSRVLWSFLEISAVTVCAWFVLRGTPMLSEISGAWGYSRLDSWTGHAGGCFGFAVLIFMIASGTGTLGECLSQRWLCFLGEISYGMYLFHPTLMRIYALYMPWAHAWPNYIKFPVFLLVLIGVSSVIHALIERPSRLAIRAAYDRRSATAFT